MFPEVMTAVIGRKAECCEMDLPGWRRIALKGRLYPGAVRDPAQKIFGICWRKLSPEDLESLDRFEGSEYARVASGCVEVGANIEVYAWLDMRLAGQEDWSPELFKQRHLKGYLRTIGP
jgi:hypothetical protein